MSYKGIAEILSIPMATVTSGLARARGRQFAIHSFGLPFHHHRETCLITSRCTGYRNAPRDQPRKGRSGPVCSEPSKSGGSCWVVSQKGKDA
jgi:hypothetical protein